MSSPVLDAGMHPPTQYISDLTGLPSAHRTQPPQLRFWGRGEVWRL